MIFAAGFGTRMRDLTRDCPKPMLEVAGKPLLDHALDHVKGAGIQRVVINTHYLPDVIESHLTGRPVTVIRETPDVLETGGGLKNALPALGTGPVITLNPDALFLGPNPVRVLRDNWVHGPGALLLVVPHDRTRCHAGPGDFDIGPDGRPIRRRGSAAKYVYTGAQIIDPTGLSDIAERAFSLNILWDRMIADGTLRAVIYDGDWVDVGTPEGLATANELAEVR